MFTGPPFLESPETFRAFFGCHNSLSILTTERVYVNKLQYRILKTCSNISLWTKAEGSFGNGFSGPKSYRDFGEMCPESVRIVDPFKTLGFVIEKVVLSIPGGTVPIVHMGREFLTNCCTMFFESIMARFSHFLVTINSILRLQHEGMGGTKYSILRSF